VSIPRPKLDERGLPEDWDFKADLEMTPREAKALLEEEGSGFVLIDCREEEEREFCQVEGSVWIPQGALIAEIDDLELEPGQRVGVICHHGRRSLQAARTLRALGYSGAFSVAGGIELWSFDIDPSIPLYTRSGREVTPAEAGD